MRVGATTREMATYPRQESNNQQIPRDVCEFPKQVMQDTVQLIAKTPQTTPISPA